MRDPFPIVAKLGERLGWPEQKALVLLTATHGDWAGASMLADALGIGPEQQEAIYTEAVQKRTEWDAGGPVAPVPVLPRAPRDTAPAAALRSSAGPERRPA